MAAHPPNDDERHGAVALVALGFAAADPVGLAAFWAAALGWDLDERTADEVVLQPTDDTRFPVRFHRRPGGGEPGRYHLDLTTSSPDDQAETVERLLAHGARHLDVGQGPEDRHVVLADPEGNPLCIIEPENRFLADCGRLGAINGDGTRAVGHFWSSALGWPLVWDQDEETAIRSADGTGPIISWGGPPVAPRRGPNRLGLELAPGRGTSSSEALANLEGLGATRVAGPPADGDRTVLEDPDGNELTLLER